MKRYTAPAIYLAFWLAAASLARGEDPSGALSLLTRTDLVRFEIVQGRLVAIGPGLVPARNESLAHPSGSPSESLAVNGAAGKLNVRYQRTDERGTLTIDFAAGSNVRLVCEPRDEAAGTKVVFEQLGKQDLTLSLDTGSKGQSFAAPSLWHLLLAEPAACREHLLPAIARLRTDWRLAERATCLERELIELCQAGVTEKRRRCEVLIDQLGSASYQARQVADRELRSLGQVVIPCLKQLDFSRLDAEQRHRLKRLADDLASSSGDTPERTAMWMLDDRAVWLALLSHDKAEYRHAAALQLARLCGRPIEFDPAAAEIERRAQIERLRQRLAGS